MEGDNNRLAKPAHGTPKIAISLTNTTPKETELVLDMNKVSTRAVDLTNLTLADPAAAETLQFEIWITEIDHLVWGDSGELVQTNCQPLRVFCVATLLIPWGHQGDTDACGVCRTAIGLLWAWAAKPFKIRPSRRQVRGARGGISRR
jgi:hypothetical protein